jgi:trehalose/maltose transport system substrate-binding protein
MFKKKTTILALAIVLVFSLLLTACSGGEDQVEQDQQEETQQEETKTVTIAGGAVGQELEMTKKAARMYEKNHPNVKIKVLDTPDLAQDRLGLYLQYLEAESSKVDLYQIDVIWPGDLAQHFLDLNQYGAEKVTDDHFQAIVENNTVDGKLVAMPWFTDAGLLYYRTDLLEEYGYDAPPKTWSELEEMAKTIQSGEREKGKKDFWGYVWQGDSYEGLTCDALEWVDSNNGGTIVSPDKKITINNENAREIVEQAAGWVGTISPNGVTGMAEESARKMWQSGNAMFMRNWPYAYALAGGDGSAVQGKFDVAPLPAGQNGEPAGSLGGWNLSVSKYSEHPEVAADVALFMTSEKVQKMRAIEASMNPTIKSLYEDEDVLEATPFFGKLYDVFVNATPRPSTATAPNYNQVSQKFYQAVHSVLTGKQDVETAFAYLERDLEDVTGFETGQPE